MQPWIVLSFKLLHCGQYIYHNVFWYGLSLLGNSFIVIFQRLLPSFCSLLCIFSPKLSLFGTHYKGLSWKCNRELTNICSLYISIYFNFYLKVIWSMGIFYVQVVMRKCFCMISFFFLFLSIVFRVYMCINDFKQQSFSSAMWKI